MNKTEQIDYILSHQRTRSLNSLCDELGINYWTARSWMTHLKSCGVDTKFARERDVVNWKKIVNKHKCKKYGPSIWRSDNRNFSRRILLGLFLWCYRILRSQVDGENGKGHQRGRQKGRRVHR